MEQVLLLLKYIDNWSFCFSFIDARISATVVVEYENEIFIFLF